MLTADETQDGAAAAGHGRPPVLDVVVPVYNEETDLEPCTRRLHEHLREYMPFTFRITIADNASTDATPEVARRMAAEFAEVRYVRVPEKGKGRALRAVWSTSDAKVLAYMDVDLSTDLAALLPLVAPLVSGHSDLAIGTRLHRGARVVRGAKREVISRSYNLMLRRTLAAGFSDGGCGFKAVRRPVALELIPHVRDNDWFFDTELLVLAEQSGLRIHEVPVDWVDDPDSHVRIVGTAMNDLSGILRLMRALGTGRLPVTQLGAQLGRAPLEPRTEGVPEGLLRQVVRFAAVGVLATVFTIVMFLALRNPLGVQVANLVTLLLATLLNTALNRRFTFGVHGPRRVVQHQVQGLVVFAVVLALSSSALYLAHAGSRDPHVSVEVTLLVAANIAATVLRFLLLRRWVFRQG